MSGIALKPNLGNFLRARLRLAMSGVLHGSGDALERFSGELGPLPDDLWNDNEVPLGSLPSDSTGFDNVVHYPGHGTGHSDSLDATIDLALANGGLTGELPSPPLAEEGLGAAVYHPVTNGEVVGVSLGPDEDTEAGSLYSGASDAATAATGTTEEHFDEKYYTDALRETVQAAALAANVAAPGVTPAHIEQGSSVDTTPVKPPSRRTSRRVSAATKEAKSDADACAVDLLDLRKGVAALQNDEYLLEMCATMAENSKQTLRDSLKKKQREEEAAATETGTPLTSAQKERTRSRRESAVTRRRAEVYLRQLEAIVRQVPALQLALVEARREGAGGLSPAGAVADGLGRLGLQEEVGEKEGRAETEDDDDEVAIARKVVELQGDFGEGGAANFQGKKETAVSGDGHFADEVYNGVTYDENAALDDNTPLEGAVNGPVGTAAAAEVAKPGLTSSFYNTFIAGSDT